MNKFGSFLGRISAKTCLKMNYYGNKFPQIAKPWSSSPDPLPLAAEGFAPEAPVHVK